MEISPYDVLSKTNDLSYSSTGTMDSIIKSVRMAIFLARGFMKHKITTAVFPVAGLGVRFLPITKSGPKEMLPIVDKPLIQYVVEEAIAAGMTHLIFVTSSSKWAIENYFDPNFELEHHLEQNKKYEELAKIRNLIPEHVTLTYVRQPKPLGLGDAILRTKKLVNDSPFAILLADDVMEKGMETCLQPMLSIYEEMQSSVIAVEEVPWEKTNQYGIVSLQSENDKQKIVSIVEKPEPEKAPTNLAVIGRYILTPQIFELLEKIQVGVGGELQLTDAIAKLIEQQSIYACPIKGKRYDCGSTLGFLKATIDFALQRPELNGSLKDYLKVKEII